MAQTKNTLPTVVLALLLTVILSAAQPSFAAAGSGLGWQAASDVQARLSKSQFKDVKVSVDGGIATLTGTVSLYEYKRDAENRARKGKRGDCSSQRDSSWRP